LNFVFVFLVIICLHFSFQTHLEKSKLKKRFTRDIGWRRWWRWWWKQMELVHLI